MRILKIILIVIFSLLLAVSGGLLAYGIINPASTQDGDNTGIGDPPDMALFEGSTHRDVSVLVSDNKMASDKKATDLMMQTAYNLVNIKQFYYSARVDVKAGISRAFSDYNYTSANKGRYTFKRAQAYTGGTVNTYVLRCYYIDQKLEETGASDYDFENKVWSYAVGPPKASSKTQSENEETPYFFCGDLDFPLDFGGVKSARGDKDAQVGRTEAINYDLIDPDSVTIEENKAGGYYTLTFHAIVAKLNASEEMKYRLSDQTTGGRMKNIEFNEFTVTATIWKESGVFRTLYYKTNISATLNGESGDTVIEKTMNFSYDDENCSIARKIKSVKGKNDALVFYEALNDANKAACDAEIKALDEAAAKKAAESADSEEKDSDKE